MGDMAHISKNLILEIGIGLETENDLIRKHCLVKNISKDKYEKAVKTLKKFRAEISTYIMLRPILLTESEAIEDALASIRYAAETGSDTIILEPIFILKNTLAEVLFIKGLCQPPWLWSVREVLHRTEYLSHIALGYPEDDPPPEYIAANCPKCTERFYKAFETFNKIGDIKVFDISCNCKIAWESVLKDQAPSLEERRRRAFYILGNGND